MGRDIQPIKISGDDRRRYREKVQRSLDVFARMLRERMFEEDPSQVGVEIELNLVDGAGNPSMRNADVLAAIADPKWATELGQFNLEINVPPRRLHGDAPAGLEEEIRGSLNTADAKARGTGSHLVMIGILPTLREEHMHESTMSANARYRVLNEQIFAARGEDLQIDIDGPEQLSPTRTPSRPEAACTSVQLHLQVSPDAFAALLERRPGHRRGAGRARRELAVPVRPRAVARDPDHRCSSRPPTPGRPSSRQQGVRPRVWFGERWITSVFDLFEENLRYFPALLPICDDEDPLAVLDRGGCPQLDEMRAAQRHDLPLEPAGLRRRRRQAAPAGREPGAAGRADGRRHAGERRLLLRADPALAEAQRPVWTQMSFATAAENFHEAARHGHRRPCCTGRATARSPVDRAGAAAPAAAGRRGPGRWGVDARQARPAAGHHRAALPAGQTGAAWQVADGAPARRRGRRTAAEALRQMTQRYIEHMHTNEPVHTWPVP